ncbi:hypothetical protein ZIOFF_032663 [Zingiber officinale]|uniref:Uncharacterized protein n=1 Tax=Zingiber officinale TaxID=94328 RepID=A0A8J5LBR2_ZINOF|nr:hypothetical protein ZIOFF_032663 [Zingiber officinale]
MNFWCSLSGKAGKVVYLHSIYLLEEYAKAIRIRFFVVERPKTCSDSYDILPPKKHADSLEDDANKVCLHDSRSVPVSAETVALLAEYG